MTAEGWLVALDRERPTDEDWRNPEYVRLISWTLIMFLPRRCGQMLIDAGYAEDARGTSKS